MNRSAARGATDILIVSAHLPELSGLLPILGNELDTTIGGLKVVAKAIGIGLPAAAAGMIAELGNFAPRVAILVGTCGAYAARGLMLGDVVVGRQLRLVSSAVAEGRAAFPAPMLVIAHADDLLSEELRQGRALRVDVATTLAITTDDALARAIAVASDCHAEHLEAFAVASVCAAQGVALATVFGVANRVGSTGREEWRAHHLAAGNSAAQLVADWLQLGAPGIPRKP